MNEGSNPIPNTPSDVNALGIVIFSISVTTSPPIKLPIAIRSPDATTSGSIYDMAVNACFFNS